ncbi:glycoside hydrolase family 13 protein [Hymenobacter swuensis]|uniref:Putative oligo-1,6-glucosidase n=1 Tax=Hymenobacter swuensis DY53 TaxID=1227739 RepID=W8F6C6_9BACT|nr:alpha-glucosidase [Hymenobacter swuensis]AHJ97310.1 putative oligo-1,6-glucosidase [Hymenobacter swuensis DY53]
MRILTKLLLATLLLAGLPGRVWAQPTTATKPTNTNQAETWWKETVVYQIYPRSFQDSNGDGVGDLQGIISRLDYLKSLGVGAVWLNPIYASPNDDNGYDISDYRRIQPEFGTMQDFDALLRGLHQRGIRLVMDMVVNHSSDEHPWFQQARSSRTSPYRNYYHWWPAEKGKPAPRYSFFDVNSDAWKYDSLTNSYYLHYFSRKQPDLNWENPKLRQEVYSMMRFWLDKGVDGLRMDAFQYVSKDTRFPVLPAGYEKDIIRYYGGGPHLHEYLQEMNREVLRNYPIMTVAEGAGTGPTDAMLFVDPARRELDMAYHFEGVDLGTGPNDYTLTDFKRVYSRWDSAFAQRGWLAIFLANHDVPRMVSKFGDDRPAFRDASSKLLTTFILTMRGTPYYFNGDELGMTNIRFERIEDYRDVATLNGYQQVKNQGGNLQAFLTTAKRQARDNCRTPFQWDATANAGFTTGTPWLKVNPNYSILNQAAQDQNPNSVLNYFRRATATRKQHKVLVYGQYQLLDAANPHVYAYTRTLGSEKVLVVLNFTSEQRRWPLPTGLTPSGQPWLNNYPSFTAGPTLALQPWQAVVVPLR